MERPVMTKLYESETVTRWIAKFPSSPIKDGAAYRVTTYSSSDFIVVDTWKTGRTVRSARAIEAIREALES